MKKVKIGNKMIGSNCPYFISLEPGATYSNFDQAKIMIDAIASSGADAVKFQTFLPGDADRLMAKKDITVNFSTPKGKRQELVYDALRRRELSKEEWKKLVEYTKKMKINFITAPYFPETVDFLKEINVDAIKVSKGDINNVILIEKIAQTGLPVILDGREKFEDVDIAVKICEKNGNDQLIIMHCPSGYPTENAGVHLLALKSLQEKYDYPIGFADHSPGQLMNFAAVSMGASMLEKTITQDKSTETVEHFMSLELSELNNFVKNIRSLEDAMGNPDILMISRVEENARRSIIAKQDIKKDQKITRDLLDFRRPGSLGISCAEGFKILDKVASQDIPQGTFLQWEMLK